MNNNWFRNATLMSLSLGFVVPLAFSAESLSNPARESLTVAADLFSPAVLEATPASVFFCDTNGISVGITSTMLGNGQSLSTFGVTESTHQLSAHCATSLTAEDVLTFGGGPGVIGTAVTALHGNWLAGQAVAKDSGLTFGPRGGTGAAVDVGSSGGDSGNTQSTQITPNSSNDSSVTTGSSRNSSRGNAANPPQPPASQLEIIDQWNVIPPPINTHHGRSTYPDDYNSAAPLPLPAPVWMGLAGLLMVVLFRHRMLP